MLQDNGYGTAFIGKWHIGMTWTSLTGETDQDQWNVDYEADILAGPLDVGFDYFFGTGGNPTDDEPLLFIENRRAEGVPTGILPYDYAGENRELRMVPGWDHTKVDTTFTSKAKQFVQNHLDTRPGEPFFVELAFGAPHRPNINPEFLVGSSNGAGARGDAVLLVNWCVGQMLDFLDSLGLTDNTLVIFTSDNGAEHLDAHPDNDIGHPHNGDWRGVKGDSYEGGHRVLFLARWPDWIKPGTTSDDFIILTDFAATAAAIVGGSFPSNAAEDSYSMLPALLGMDSLDPARESGILHSSQGVFVARRGDWTYIHESTGSGQDPPTPGSAGQLFNMATDPYQTTNVYDDNPDTVAALAALLETYQTQGYSYQEQGCPDPTAINYNPHLTAGDWLSCVYWSPLPVNTKIEAIPFKVEHKNSGLEISILESGSHYLKVYDIKGALRFSKSGTGKTSYSVSGLSTGMFIVKADMQGKMHVEKVFLY
jgi:arylsulfatase A-like enzyme